LRRWRFESGLLTEGDLARRLALDHLTLPDFRALLGETPEALQDRTRAIPSWMAECMAAFSVDRPNDAAPLTVGPIPGASAEHPMHAVLEALDPLIERGCDRLRQRLQRRVSVDDCALHIRPDRYADLFLARLRSRLAGMLSQAVVLELQVARLSGELEGDTPEDRWINFVHSLCTRRQTIAFLREYPVLARQIVESINRWVDTSALFVGRLCTDWPSLHATFQPECSSSVELQQVTSVGADLHYGGASVLVAEFSSGLRIVYKPRPAAMDRHFHHLSA